MVIFKFIIRIKEKYAIKNFFILILKSYILFRLLVCEVIPLFIFDSFSFSNGVGIGNKDSN